MIHFEHKKFRGKKACVLGLGRSGAAVARLLAAKGYRVFGSDLRSREEVAKSLGRTPAKLKWEAGRHSDRVLRAAFVVKSPGIPRNAPVVLRLLKKGVPVFSELEVALAFCRSKRIVAITGTNGKSTTAALTAEILRGAGRKGKVHLCGNIGLPVSTVAALAGPKDTLVIEVSSYQLEDSYYFKPRTAAILNITSEHLDHHGGMTAYIDAKARIFRQQAPPDTCVFNAEDPLTIKTSRRCRTRKLFYGAKGRTTHAWIEKGRIYVSLPGKKPTALPAPALPGRHNLENAMAAVLLALGEGLKPKQTLKGLKGFRGIAHRLEELGNYHGLRCINDSKATNVDSTLTALTSFGEGKKDVLLIMGGMHKGLPYTPLRSFIERRVKCILSIGGASGKIDDDLSHFIQVFPCGDLHTAVETAFKIGAKKDILLLSPACASFDQFKDFEERGRSFTELIKKL